MASKTQSYIGKGSVYIGRKGKRPVRIGNTSKLEFSFEEETKDLQDYESTGGGKADSVSRIKAVKLSLTVHDLSPENVALAMRGTVADIAGGNVVDERHDDVQAGTLVVFAKPQDMSKPLEVKRADAMPADPDFVDGVDYLRKRAGIVILAGGGIHDGDDIEVSYTATPGVNIQALTDVGEEVALIFDGINEANGLPLLVDVFRMKPGASKGWSLIGDDFSALEIESEVLSDDSKAGTGLSKFFSARMGRDAS